MLFQGTYTTPFYRLVRNLLHDEAEAGPATDRRALEARWAELEAREGDSRTPRPTTVPVPGQPPRPRTELRP